MAVVVLTGGIRTEIISKIKFTLWQVKLAIGFEIAHKSRKYRNKFGPVFYATL